MTISQGRVSVCQYYNIVWKYNITYVLYMANSQGNITILSFSMSILQYCVEIQYNVRTLHG